MAINCVDYFYVTTFKVWIIYVMFGYIRAASVVKTFDRYDYGIVIDAGSSGSRIRVYKWPPREYLNHVPNVTEIKHFTKQPGISNFVNHLNGLEDYIKELISLAEQWVPEDKHDKTPIYVMATAGMRLLLERHANNVINKIDSILQNRSINPFQYEEHINTRILSGEEEGVFAWISANYLRGYFQNPDTTQSVGILEMGGASTQIAFMHSGSILADKFPVTIAGNIYPLYVHSYLSFGQGHLENRIRDDLYEMDMSQTTVNNPCMLRDDKIKRNISGKEITFIGSGQPDKCVELIDTIVYKVEDTDHCSPKPCAIGSVYQPSIGTQTFYAIAAYSFTLRNLGAVNTTDDTFSPADTTEAAYQFCSKTIDRVKNETGKPDYKYHSTECMMGLYIPILLVKGYGFSNTTRQLVAVKRHQKIEWPLGAIIYENERRDWTCVPPVSSHLSSSGYLHSGAPFSILITIILFICRTIFHM